MIPVTEIRRGNLFEYIHREINLPWSSDFKCIAAQRDDLSIAGVVAYTTWLEDSVFMHVAAASVTKNILREAFRYPFVQCDKKRVYGLTPITSHKALVFSKRLGFRPVVETADFLLQVMTREECRWLNDTERTDRRNS